MSGLRRGRSSALEAKPVRPVDEKNVLATLPYVSRQIRAMIELQMLTGMRSGEVGIMRGYDLDRSGKVWAYMPATHKTEHHDIDRRFNSGPELKKSSKDIYELTLGKQKTVEMHSRKPTEKHL